MGSLYPVKSHVISRGDLLRNSAEPNPARCPDQLKILIYDKYSNTITVVSQLQSVLPLHPCIPVSLYPCIPR